MEKASPLQSKMLVLISFALVLAVAAYFRLGIINLAEFKSDEAGILFIVRGMIQNGKIPLLGASLTTGGSAGPFYYYIMGIPFLVSQNRVFPSVMKESLSYTLLASSRCTGR